MAHAGQQLEGPNGMRLRILSITEELLEMQATYTGEGPLPPPHLHPRQAEHFEVLEGAVRTVIDGVERRYETGEHFDVPPATVHQMGGEGAAVLSWQVRPALRTAEFMEGMYTGAAAQDPAGYLSEYAPEFRLAGAPGEG